MTRSESASVTVQALEEERGWAIVIQGRRAIVVPNESTATLIAEELTAWLKREKPSQSAA